MSIKYKCFWLEYVDTEDYPENAAVNIYYNGMCAKVILNKFGECYEETILNGKNWVDDYGMDWLMGDY